jgi:hypothetical protein
MQRVRALRESTGAGGDAAKEGRDANSEVVFATRS